MAQQVGAEREKARTIEPLRGLWPFMRPYRASLWAALAALTATALLTLSLPIAVRRVVDNFFAESLRIVDAYFAAALGIAALLAIGTALRYLSGDPARRAGDRRYPAGDLRPGHRDEPGLLRADHDRGGAVAADDGHDARPVGDRLLGVGRAAQRADARRRARASAGHEPEADRAGARRRAGGAGADPRARAPGQGAVAREPGPDRRRERAGVREPARGADGAGLYPRGGEPGGVRRSRRALVRRRPAADQDPGGAERDRDLPRLRRDRRGALDRGARRAFGRDDPGFAGAVRDLCGHRRRRGGVALRDLGRAAAGGGRDRAYGRAPACGRQRRRSARAGAGPPAAQGRDRVRGRHLPLSGAAADAGARRARSQDRTGGDRGAGRAVGRRKDHDLPAPDAVLRSRRGAGDARRRSTCGTWRGWICGASSRWCRRSR